MTANKPWEAISHEEDIYRCPVCLRAIRMVRPISARNEPRWVDLVLARHNKSKGVKCEGSGLTHGDKV